MALFYGSYPYICLYFVRYMYIKYAILCSPSVQTAVSFKDGTFKKSGLEGTY